MKKIAVVTTFPDNCWDVYAKEMLNSFVKHWPSDIPLLVNLNDDLLLDDVKRILREGDGVTCGWEQEHLDFVNRNKDKEHKTDYRKQAIKFCHKVFAIKHTLTAIESAKKEGALDTPRYLIWMDADVTTTNNVSRGNLDACLPKEGSNVSYLGRKDWDHSECGWLAFDLENGGDKLINDVVGEYLTDNVFNLEQWHDSFVWDQHIVNGTNLTEGKPGMDIWPQSPMASFSVHHKGPVAKNKMTNKAVPLTIQTKNSIPDASIHRNILENQTLITNWVKTCTTNDEEIAIVSAGPLMIAEDLTNETCKIVAVKHALKPLKEAGIKPWACILLDPRPHVNDFVENPDTGIIWFVASQVESSVVRKLLNAGCTVWGYHAAVGANEDDIIDYQSDSIVSGGSATATRGLFVLDKLGFRRFKLYGYDLCFPDKPDLDLKDDIGQPKYFEVSINANHRFYKAKRAFWSSGELLAQYQEIVDCLTKKDWDIKAFGSGIVPFMVNAKRTGDLREKKKKSKITPVSYERLFKCKKMNKSSTVFLNLWPLTLLKRRQERN